MEQPVIAQPQILVNQAGPLPITASFPAPGVGPATLVVAGSVWSRTADRQKSQSVGSAAIWSNGPNTHRAAVPSHIPVELDKPWEGDPPQPPTYTVELVALTADTVSDENDWFQVSLLA